MGVVGALGGRRQAEPERGQGEHGRLAVGRAGQVVALVEDDQAEPVAEPAHVQVGRVVSRDGQGLDVVLAAADQADLGAEGQRQLVVPLVHQVDRRRDDQASAARPARWRGWPGGSCRSPSAGRPRPGPPAFHQASSPSVWCGKASLTTRNGQGGLRRSPGVVAVADLVAVEVLDDRPVPDRLGAVEPRPGVEPDAGEPEVSPSASPSMRIVPPSKVSRSEWAEVVDRAVLIVLWPSAPLLDVSRVSPTPPPIRAYHSTSSQGPPRYRQRIRRSPGPFQGDQPGWSSAKAAGLPRARPCS